MENYRTIHDGSEILSLIQKANRKDFGQVWQTKGPLRQTYQILALATDAAHGAVMVETQRPFDFSRDYPIYVRISDRNLIFKLNDNYLVKKNRLICQVPAEAKAMELRTTERFHLPANKNIQLKLKPLEAAAMDVTVKLSDFSQKGIGVIVSEVNQEYFKRIETFSIQSIAGIKLGKLTTKVKHVGVNKVGLSLDESFDKGTYTYLQNFLL